mmetsp:Transcript_42240/g.104089  ORF Transcript_42240/g.104089 Transcript_42240/m.104089 type:complete len:240 (-) Transcript_42240:522-1241(-)
MAAGASSLSCTKTICSARPGHSAINTSIIRRVAVCASFKSAGESMDGWEESGRESGSSCGSRGGSRGEPSSTSNASRNFMLARSHSGRTASSERVIISPTRGTASIPPTMAAEASAGASTAAPQCTATEPVATAACSRRRDASNSRARPDCAAPFGTSRCAREAGSAGGHWKLDSLRCARAPAARSLFAQKPVACTCSVSRAVDGGRPGSRASAIASVNLLRACPRRTGQNGELSRLPL